MKAYCITFMVIHVVLIALMIAMLVKVYKTRYIKNKWPLYLMDGGMALLNVVNFFRLLNELLKM